MMLLDLPPVVSVVIPLYNQGKYLKECIKSLKAQTFSNFEVVVVNDCSADKSGEIAEKLNLSVIHHAENLGLSAARNTGIAAAKGRYILCLDADDKLAPNAIERMVEMMEDEMGDIIYTDIREFGERDRIVAMPEYCFEMLRVMNLMTSCCLYKKEHWQEVGGYDETMKSGLEDWKFIYEMGLNGHYGYKIAEPLFYYRIKKVSMITKTREHHEDVYRDMIKKLKEKYGENLHKM